MNTTASRPRETAQKWTHLAVVRFSLRFPLDMLRYDRCFPFREGDSTLMGGDVLKGTVVVMKNSEHKDWNKVWTTGRWKSFGATLTEPTGSLPDPKEEE